MTERLDSRASLLVDPAEHVLDLADTRARDTRLAGAKAANLASSLASRLPVIPGFVITTTGAAQFGADLGPDHPIRRHWAVLSRAGQRPLAVRSSSVAEDSENSSMAGRFLSVLNVTGWDDFVKAVTEVIASGRSVAEARGAPMAVLVQPMADARVGGVMFGLNPLTGDLKRLLLSMTEGAPEQIVSGAVTGTTLVLNRAGRIVSVSGPVPARLSVMDRRRLARLAHRTAKLFGGPQDMEWLIEPGGTLRLLQSRPVTASAVPASKSHPLGPGPVAETFPDPLSALERDLWEAPLEDGLREALRISGAVSKRQLSNRFVVDVGGRVAVDLQALGVITPKGTFWSRLDVREPARHLRAAWRIGRLQVAMPEIVADLADDVDQALAAMPALSELGNQQLLQVLANARSTLVGLHAHEVLSGFFLDRRNTGATSSTSASVALAVLAAQRLEGKPDEDIRADHPVTLVLSPPRIGAAPPLPPITSLPSMPTGEGDNPLALAREAMRMRVRWVQELTARAALELGARLAGREQLRQAEDVRELDLQTLRHLVGNLDVAWVVRANDEDSPALPPVFRLAADGSIVADTSTQTGGVQGVSAGRGQGLITHDRSAAHGAVLVVSNLDPDLAGVLPDLAALVCATGSPLSHLAILAREYRVPVVVGYREPLADGVRVLVDGGAGTVEVLS